MKYFSTQIQNTLLNANAKALATFYNNDVNVIPVSTVKIVGGKIWLIDYFFNKTKANFLQNPKVALTFWIGLKGYQIKALTSYHTKGIAFKNAVNWVATLHPNSIVKGLLILEIIEIFDISINNKKL